MKFFKRFPLKLQKSSFVACYKEFINGNNEFDDPIINAFDQNYAFPTLYDFLDKHTTVLDVQENSISYTYQFEYNGVLFLVRVYSTNPRVLLVRTAKEFSNPITKDTAAVFCNKVNSMDPIHQIGIIKVADKKLFITAARQIIFTSSMGDISSIEHCLNQLIEYVNMLSEGQLPKASDWKQYALKPITSVVGAEKLWFHSKSDGGLLYEFSKNNKIVSEDDEKTVHQMINIIDENHVVNAFGRQVFLDTSLIEDYTITTYKEFPYLITFCATVYPANYTSRLLVTKKRMIEVALKWNQSNHYSVIKVIPQIPSHWQGGDEADSKYKIIMSGLFAESINTYTYYNMIGTMEKAIGFLIEEHGLY